MNLNDLRKSLFIYSEQEKNESIKSQMNEITNKLSTCDQNEDNFVEISSFVMKSLSSPNPVLKEYALKIFVKLSDKIMSKQVYDVTYLHQHLSMSLVDQNKSIKLLAVEAILKFMKANKHDSCILNTFWPLIINPIQYFIKSKWVHDDDLKQCFIDMSSISVENTDSLIEKIMSDKNVTIRKKDFVSEISHFIKQSNFNLNSVSLSNSPIEILFKMESITPEKEAQINPINIQDISQTHEVPQMDSITVSCSQSQSPKNRSYQETSNKDPTPNKDPMSKKDLTPRKEPVAESISNPEIPKKDSTPYIITPIDIIVNALSDNCLNMQAGEIDECWQDEQAKKQDVSFKGSVLQVNKSEPPAEVKNKENRKKTIAKLRSKVLKTQDADDADQGPKKFEFEWKPVVDKTKQLQNKDENGEISAKKSLKRKRSEEAGINEEAENLNETQQRSKRAKNAVSYKEISISCEIILQHRIIGFFERIPHPLYNIVRKPKL